MSTEEVLPTPDMQMLVKSAFAHSLRTTPPRPVNEFMEHFACAIILARYVVVANQDPNDPDSVSLALILPSYEDEELREGYVVIGEGLDLPEKARAAFEDVAQNNSPAAMIHEMSKGPLKSLFEFVITRTEEIRSSEDLPTFKRAMTKIVQKTLGELQAKVEALGSSRLPDLDPLLAEAEASIIKAFAELSTQESNKAYFAELLKLHSELEADSAAALEDLMAPPQQEHGHDHSHEHDGQCCSGH